MARKIGIKPHFINKSAQIPGKNEKKAGRLVLKCKRPLAPACPKGADICRAQLARTALHFRVPKDGTCFGDHLKIQLPCCIPQKSLKRKNKALKRQGSQVGCCLWFLRHSVHFLKDHQVQKS